MPNPLQRLYDFGQSFWYDNIRRDLLTSGELARMVREDGLRGLTSNPTIFAKAVAGSNTYDDIIRRCLNLAPEEIFLELALEDIRAACGVFRELYETSRGGDGYASLEVFPDLARDAAGTIAQARRLWARLDCPNAMIKIPSTPECIPAIRAVLAEGINVNVTLMFGFDSYQAVLAAYLDALEDRAAAGLPIDRIASVASLFVSRVDTKCDPLFLQAGAPQLEGQAALANARRMYAHFQETFAGPRWARLAGRGARPQRLLWASTSTKNPKYPDTYYAEALIGPHTVDTMPDVTVTAFRDHGQPAERLAAGLAQAAPMLEKIARSGIGLDARLLELQNEGVDAFEASFRELIDTVRARVRDMRAVIAHGHSAVPFSLGAPTPLRIAAEDALEKLRAANAGARVWRRDATLWSADAAIEAVVANRLGWLDLPSRMLARAPAVAAFARECRESGIRAVVLLGMGGSSLAPEVFGQVFAREGREADIDLHVLDTTHPDTIAAVASRLQEAGHGLNEALFVVSSKSGGTIEPNCLFAYFWDLVSRDSLCAESPGDQFIAITDPGTSLERLAAERHFRRLFLNPPDIGGRYSALSYFGLVPAALLGADVETLLRRASVMAQACAADVAPADNPALRLGAALGAWAAAGLDKLTFLCDTHLEGFGAWLEQLVAESTGKSGRGIVPVSREEFSPMPVYENDRVFARLRVRGPADGLAPSLVALGVHSPVLDFELADPYDLGQEIFRWEFATVLAGQVMGIDPFDEPNVQESKDNTVRVLGEYLKGGAEAAGFTAPPSATLRTAAGEVRAWAPRAPAAASVASLLRAWVGAVAPGDYVALLAYLDRNDETWAALDRLRLTLRDRLRVATTLGFGPSYLHSSGQLHKGGSNRGVYLVLTAPPRRDLPIPGRGFSFHTLLAAQAVGDAEALEHHGRRLLRLDLGADVLAGLDELTQLADEAAGAAGQAAG